MFKDHFKITHISQQLVTQWKNSIVIISVDY